MNSDVNSALKWPINQFRTASVSHKTCSVVVGMFRRLGIFFGMFFGLNPLFADNPASDSNSTSPRRPLILIYGDAHGDFGKLRRMFEQAEKMGVDYVIGGGDLTEGRSRGEAERSYRFVAEQLHWLASPPYNPDFQAYRFSKNWIEIMGNKEEYGFLRIFRKAFGRSIRGIVSKMAWVPDNKPDEAVILRFPTGKNISDKFSISISHMPLTQLDEKLRGNTSERNWRNILWPLNWPLPGFAGAEPSTRSAMKKNYHPRDVDLVVYFHVHVAGAGKDKETGTAMVSPGSPSKNKVPSDQRTATYMTVDTETSTVFWHDIDEGGKVYQTLELNSLEFKKNGEGAHRISKPPLDTDLKFGIIGCLLYTSDAADE